MRSYQKINPFFFLIVTLRCGPLDSDIQAQVMQTFNVEKGETFKMELYFKYVLKTENHVAAAIWENGLSDGLNKKT